MPLISKIYDILPKIYGEHKITWFQSIIELILTLSHEEISKYLINCLNISWNITDEQHTVINLKMVSAAFSIMETKQEPQYIPIIKKVTCSFIEHLLFYWSKVVNENQLDSSLENIWIALCDVLKEIMLCGQEELYPQLNSLAMFLGNSFQKTHLPCILECFATFFSTSLYLNYFFININIFILF